MVSPLPLHPGHGESPSPSSSTCKPMILHPFIQNMVSPLPIHPVHGEFMILHPFIQYMVSNLALHPVHGESSTPSSSAWWVHDPPSLHPVHGESMVLHPFIQYMVSPLALHPVTVSPLALHPVHGESSTPSSSTWWVLHPFIQYMVSPLCLHPVHGESSTLHPVHGESMILYLSIQLLASKSLQCFNLCINNTRGQKTPKLQIENRKWRRSVWTKPQEACVGSCG